MHVNIVILLMSLSSPSLSPFSLSLPLSLSLPSLSLPLSLPSQVIGLLLNLVSLVGHALIVKVVGIIFVLICSFVPLLLLMGHWLIIMSMLLISATSKRMCVLLYVWNACLLVVLMSLLRHSFHCHCEEFLYHTL